MLLNYKSAPSIKIQPAETDQEEVTTTLTFTQTIAPLPGTNGSTHANIKCFNCNSMGHYSGSCPCEEGGIYMLQYQDEQDAEPPAQNR